MEYYSTAGLSNRERITKLLNFLLAATSPSVISPLFAAPCKSATLCGMKIMLQIAFVLAVCIAGDVISALLPFTFPGSICAMLLLFALFCTGAVKPAQLNPFGNWLLGNMAFFFLPANLMIMQEFELISHVWLQILFIAVVSTVTTFAAAAGAATLAAELQQRVLHGSGLHGGKAAGNAAYAAADNNADATMNAAASATEAAIEDAAAEADCANATANAEKARNAGAMANVADTDDADVAAQTAEGASNAAVARTAVVTTHIATTDSNATTSCRADTAEAHNADSVTLAVTAGSCVAAPAITSSSTPTQETPHD